MEFIDNETGAAHYFSTPFGQYNSVVNATLHWLTTHYIVQYENASYISAVVLEFRDQTSIRYTPVFGQVAKDVRRLDKILKTFLSLLNPTR